QAKSSFFLDQRIHREIRQIRKWPAAVAEAVLEIRSPSCGVERASILIGTLACAEMAAARRALEAVAEIGVLPRSHLLIARRALERAARQAA
ncbi:MAG: hypothetical protein ACYS0K_18180, partial [Planctomycetota bacterium]